MITLLLLVRATYMYGVVLHAHPVCGESHIQHNTTGEVATLSAIFTVLKTQKDLLPKFWLFCYTFGTRNARKPIKVSSNSVYCLVSS